VVHARVDQIPPFILGESGASNGTLEWFNATTGFGFIQPAGGGKVDIVLNKGKESAENLRVS
jgi:'Cold-shock' DNA-binding domain